jgi:hypothetical protein
MLHELDRASAKVFATVEESFECAAVAIDAERQRGTNRGRSK